MLLFVTVALIGLLAFAAWSLETGRVWAAKSHLQAGTDSSALAGAAALVPPGGDSSDPAAALATAQSYGRNHDVEGEALEIAAADVETGSWDLASRSFTPLPGSTDRDRVRAVRVVGRRDATQNGEIPTVLGRIFGVDGIPVTGEAIGYLGFAGVIPPGKAELPVAIDCCAIAGDSSGSECQEDFCDTVTRDPPNPCPLDRDPSTTVSCLEFHDTTEQNACWTQFDSQSSSVNTSDLADIVEDANDFDVGDEPIFVDNGTKTPIVQDIRDRFHGEGAFSADGPAGEDTDGDGTVDSWVTAFPVVECQNPGDNCAGRDPAEVVGVVCFDIQEVVVQPKLIKGEFLCRSDPRFDRCDTTGFGTGGSVNTGIDAQAPVLVR